MALYVLASAVRGRTMFVPFYHLWKSGANKQPVFLIHFFNLSFVPHTILVDPYVSEMRATKQLFLMLLPMHASCILVWSFHQQ